MPGYAAVWCAILLSGLGVAMFHPAAGKAARQDAGDSAAAMSVFAAGGSVGFFLAPALATPALIALGCPPPRCSCRPRRSSASFCCASTAARPPAAPRRRGPAATGGARSRR